MEYVEGETLAHLIFRAGKVAEGEVRRIGVEICNGLEHVHSQNVIHRDLKPGNIVLGQEGAVKIADFGIARVSRDSISRLTSAQDSGTLLYMSPERQFDMHRGVGGNSGSVEIQSLRFPVGACCLPPIQDIEGRS